MLKNEKDIKKDLVLMSIKMEKKKTFDEVRELMEKLLQLDLINSMTKRKDRDNEN